MAITLAIIGYALCVYGELHAIAWVDALGYLVLGLALGALKIEERRRRAVDNPFPRFDDGRAKFRPPHEGGPRLR